ncbi:MAG: hypothetical protein J6O55_08940 [Lachnospiraceae bacterium]|nr:hypothetical protein [Lachnospiraceae bacterium]
MKKTTRILLMVIGFYLVAGLMALFFLDGRTSIFKGDEKAVAKEKDTFVDNRQIVGDVTKSNSNMLAEAEPVPEEPPKDEAPLAEPAPSEPAPEEPVAKEPEPVYYSFTVSTRQKRSRLYVREHPYMESRSLKLLKTGTKGYILELGNEWSKVYVNEKLQGYSNNEFLVMEDCDPSEFPEGYEGGTMITDKY